MHILWQISDGHGGHGLNPRRVMSKKLFDSNAVLLSN